MVKPTREEIEAIARELPDDGPEDIVNGVMMICDAMGRWDCSTRDLIKLFRVALKNDGMDLAAIKLEMVAMALGYRGELPP